MEWVKSMNKVIEYLENHLKDEIDLNEVAGLTCSSPFHFQKMFHILTGVTVAEYVRRRRLTLAAQELVSSKAKVIDIALKYGYNTPESFSRAFRRLHGISPSAAAEPGANLKVFPRLSFQISLKGDRDMDYRIIETLAFKVIGKGRRVTTQDGENFKKVPAFWEESCQKGLCRQLENLAEEDSLTRGILLGICLDYDREMKEFIYFIGVENKAQSLDGLEERVIPASTWAVFDSIGPLPDAIQSLIKRIYSEWFPAADFEHTGGPELEVYLPGNPDDANYRCEVWIPIKRVK